MTAKLAGSAMLGSSIVLAALMVAKLISVTTGCFLFAVALALFGGISRGYTRTDCNKR